MNIGYWLQSQIATLSPLDRTREQALGTPLDFQTLMALVGHFLLRWGWLEDSLRGRPVPAELDSIRRIRNAISHRMVAAHADPHGTGAAFVTCRLSDATVVQFSASELEEAIRVLERKAPRLVAD